MGVTDMGKRVLIDAWHIPGHATAIDVSVVVTGFSCGGIHCHIT
jgi:hypothetical protein